MTNVKKALTRKFGPLPAYVWLGIVAAALYIYRRGGVGELRAGMPQSTDTTSVGSASDNAESRAPITLGPGESVYDPNTGQLIGTAPDQSGLASDTSTSDTGGVAAGDVADAGVGNVAPTVTGGTHKQPAAGFHKGHSAGHQFFLPGTGWVSKARYLAGKRKNKKTTKKGTAVKHPTHGKSRNRSGAKLLDTVRKKKASKPPKGRTRGAGKPATPRQRTRTHKVGTHPVTRQHPAGTPKIVHPGTQKVTPHPPAHAQQPTHKVTHKKRKR